MDAALRDVFIDVKTSRLPENLRRRRGVFVTLVRNGSVRGCMGTFWPLHKNAGRELIWSGLQAAFNDVRFPPLVAGEREGLEAVVDLIDSPRSVLPDELDPSSPVLAFLDGTAVVMLPLEGIASWDEAVSFGGPGALADSAPARIVAELTAPIPPGDLIRTVQEALGVGEVPSMWTASHERISGPLPYTPTRERDAD